MPHNVAGIRLDRSVDDLHERALAGAIFTQHRMNFAGRNGQRHRIIRYRAGIALGHRPQFQTLRHGQPFNRPCMPATSQLMLLMSGSLKPVPARTRTVPA